MIRGWAIIGGAPAAREKPKPVAKRRARRRDAPRRSVILFTRDNQRGAAASLAADPRWRAHPVAFVRAGAAITESDVAAAFRALRFNPYAVGPTEEGGFWIFAARDGRAGAALIEASDTLDDLLGRLPRMPAELKTIP